MNPQILILIVIFELSYCLINSTNKKWTVPIIKAPAQIISINTESKNYTKDDNTTSVRIKNDPIFPLLPSNVAFLLIG